MVNDGTGAASMFSGAPIKLSVWAFCNGTPVGTTSPNTNGEPFQNLTESAGIWAGDLLRPDVLSCDGTLLRDRVGTETPLVLECNPVDNGGPLLAMSISCSQATATAQQTTGITAVAYIDVIIP
jgi:hypothetical protein